MSLSVPALGAQDVRAQPFKCLEMNEDYHRALIELETATEDKEALTPEVMEEPRPTFQEVLFQQ